MAERAEGGEGIARARTHISSTKPEFATLCAGVLSLEHTCGFNSVLWRASLCRFHVCYASNIVTYRTSMWILSERNASTKRRIVRVVPEVAFRNVRVDRYGDWLNGRLRSICLLVILILLRCAQ